MNAITTAPFARRFASGSARFLRCLFPTTLRILAAAAVLATAGIASAQYIWTARDSDRQWNAVASSNNGDKLVAVAYNGNIYTSTNSGANWTPQPTAGSRAWFGVASSELGDKLVAVVEGAAPGGYPHTSTDSGATWTEQTSVGTPSGQRVWHSVASSYDGVKLVAAEYYGKLYTSTNSGASWTARDSDRPWWAVASSSDGQYLVAVDRDGTSFPAGGKIYTSIDFGATWTPRDSNRVWTAVASSATGEKLIAAVEDGQIYISTDYGVSWQARETNRKWAAVASSANGDKLVAVAGGRFALGKIYTSSDSGATWTPQESDRHWISVACSENGEKIVAADFTGRLYTGVFNTAPVNTVPGPQTVNEDTLLAISGISVNDIDGNLATTKLTVTHGTLNVLLTGGASISDGANGSPTLTLSGTQTQINTALGTVSYTGALNNSGADTLSVLSTDALAATDSDNVGITVSAVNDAPTISNITNKSTNEDTATGAIAFTVNDVETALDSLVVTRTSSNTALVPNANIVLGGSGASRTVTVTPAPNQSGTTTILLTVSDGSLTANDTFILTVNAVNDAPTISNITNKSTNEDTATAAIAFTVGDVETAAGSLTVTGTSSNTALVPNANIVFGGSGANRTVTVTPVPNQSGTATITLTVSDGDLTDTDTFVLTVVKKNDAPTISKINDKSTNEDTATAAIAFTVGDLETAAGSLTVTGISSNTALVPNTNIVFGGSGASRTVTVTPAPNKSGTANITVRVSDGTAQASETFILTVVKKNDAPTISKINDKFTDEDTPTDAITFTVKDVDTSLGELTVSGTSNNIDLVPITNIDFAGTGANRTVTVTPARNQSGTATITVKVSDGNMTTSETFKLEVTAVNDAPTISKINDETTDEDTPADAINFTVKDVDTSLGELTVIATSDDTTLVPKANIVLVGKGADRSVTVTPALDQNGTATITVMVSDGKLTTSETFKLTVAAVNDPPSFTKGEDLKLDINEPNIKLSWATNVSPGPRDESNQRVSFIVTSSNPRLLDVTVGSTGKMVISSIYAYGSATITLKAVDNGNPAASSATQTFTIKVIDLSGAPPVMTVSDGISGPSPLTLSGLPSHGSDGNQTAATQGMDRTTMVTEIVDGQKYLALRIHKSPGSQDPGREVEVSSNLLDWYSGNKHTTILQDDANLLMVRDNTPLVPGKKRYIRLTPHER